MPFGDHLFDLRRAFPVFELAAVEVSGLAVDSGLDVQPAEEDVAGGLHQPLPDHDPLTVV
jgi:hypothetical protein